MVSAESINKIYSLKLEVTEAMFKHERSMREIARLQQEFEKIVSNMNNMDQENCRVRLQKILNRLEKKKLEADEEEKFLDYAKQEIARLQSEIKVEF